MIPANVESKEIYAGDDLTSSFPYDFPTFESDNVTVRVEDSAGIKTTLTLSTHYTIDGIGKLSGGGKVNLAAGAFAWLNANKLKIGYNLHIEYTVKPKQLSRFRDLGPHAPAEFERALDRVTMEIIALIGVGEALGLLSDGYLPTGPQTIAAGGTVSVLKNNRQHKRVLSDGGAKALSITPFGSNPALFQDGMEIVVEAQSTNDYLTLAVNDADYGYIGNGGLVLRKGVVLTFIYSATLKRFLIKSFGAW